MAARALDRPVLLPPVTRRIGRLKLLTAVVLVGFLGVVLLLFAFLVARADARYEQERVDRLLERRVAAGQDAVRVDDDGRADVAELARRPELAGGYPQLYVVEVAADGGGARVALEPAAPTWPDVDVVDAAVEAVAHSETVASATTARRGGASGPAERLSVLAAPVPGAGEAGGGTMAAVVAVATRTPGEANHGRLLGYMWWSAALMVACVLGVAVLLSRGRWWLADQVLARHEAFLRDTAHELRGPVSSLRAVAQAGLAGAEPPERALERVAAIVRGTDELVEDLLTLSRMQTGQEPLQAAPVRLDELVTALVRARADEPPVALAVEPTTVVANAELVRRAVGNLLDNAVRHGRACDPTAAVTVTVAGGRVEVADAGPGLEPQILPDLVDRSGNGHRTTGARLGLTLTRRVAHVHGGELRAANRPGGGAVFTLELPAGDR